jgi:hypothetical protein
VVARRCLEDLEILSTEGYVWEAGERMEEERVSRRRKKKRNVENTVKQS